MTKETHVLKHAVGLETSGKRHSLIFSKGMHLPVSCSIAFSTALDDQDSFSFIIHQGDAERVDDCRKISEFLIQGIAANQPRGEPKIKATLSIDETGALHCTARELPHRSLTVEGQADAIVMVAEDGW